MLDDLRNHLKGMTKQQVLDFIAEKNPERVLTGFEKVNLLFGRGMKLADIEEAWKAGEFEEFGLEIPESSLESFIYCEPKIDIFKLDEILTTYFKENPERVLAVWEGDE